MKDPTVEEMKEVVEDMQEISELVNQAISAANLTKRRALVHAAAAMMDEIGGKLEPQDDEREAS
jgi:methyl-accepting chemotaxis protein